MDKELARTLTVALVNYLDENRPEGTMDCSSGECEAIENAFREDNFFYVETLTQRKLSRLTEFEKAFIERVFHQKPEDLDKEIKEIFREDARFVLDLAMTNLERAVTCGNVDNIPKWLQEELNKAFKKGKESSHEDYLRGYSNGYKDALSGNG